MQEAEKPDGGFNPIVQFDVFRGTPAGFVEITEVFDRAIEARGTPPPLNLSNGWYRVTPEQAEVFLGRNRKGANRQPALATVRYYARQMLRNDWPRTGQPIIFSQSGVLNDGGHRCWAAYLSGASFETYIVADVPDTEYAFAYIDNSRARTPAVALRTAGFDGVSPFINAIIQIRESIKEGLYSCARPAHRPERLSPKQTIEIAVSDPFLKRAARLTAGEYQVAITLVDHKDIVGYMTYAILEAGHADSVVDDWWREFEMPEADLPKGNAALAFRVLLRADQAKAKPLPKHLVLAHGIKAFNAWLTGEPVKSLKISVTDDYPVITRSESVAEVLTPEAENK
jgi:hypothetical protein